MSGDGDGRGNGDGHEPAADDERRVDGGRRLAVEADLSIRVAPAGRAAAPLAEATPAAVEVWSDGSAVTVDCPSFRTARALLSGLDALPVSPDRVGSELDASGVTVRVRVRRATVATLGPDVRPRYRRLAERVGAPTAAISLRGVLVGALRRLL